MKLGIIGLPNVGKSTLFNAITNAGAQSANYPFCTIDPNVGVVSVPDTRLDVLTEMYQPAKVTPAVIEFVDIAGLVKGASRGEGLGNKFLANIREVDAIVHVVRCFNNDDIIHVDGSIDALRDMETISLELIFADMEAVERRLDRTKKALKGDKSLEAEVQFLQRVLTTLEAGHAARTIDTTPEEEALLHSLTLLTAKPVIYAANLSEADFSGGSPDSNPHYQQVAAAAAKEGAEVLPICAQMEADIADMDDEEKEMFLSELGLTHTGLDRLIQKSYHLLGLISYLTAGPTEVRAWTITRGTKAPQAAGKIHTDFERGFIRAEVVSYDDLTACGSMNAAKEKGLVRSEGKEYVMQDGDVVLFRFNV
ncbi:MAG: redox-regulated ATPase YchF [Clostridia bacterium]|nr:redox-regulated ATPase YchF [Clostridia bacterium]